MRPAALTPRMAAALADAAPHGLARARAGWFRCGPGGGFSLEGPHHSPASVAALLDRGLLRLERPDRAVLSPRGAARLAALSTPDDRRTP